MDVWVKSYGQKMGSDFLKKKKQLTLKYILAQKTTFLLQNKNNEITFVSFFNFKS